MKLHVMLHADFSLKSEQDCCQNHYQRAQLAAFWFHSALVCENLRGQMVHQ